MSYTSKQGSRLHQGLSRVPGLVLLFTIPVALAQSPEAELADVRQTLASLDQQAGACQQALDQSGAGTLPPECREFLAAIDGETVANYLSQCRTLRQWRDDFIAANRQADANSTDSLNLQRLMNIEYYCAENALLVRTSHVADAFAAIGAPALANLRSELAGDRFDRQQRQWRRDSTPRSMNQRLRAETDRLWRELELENLRQQLNRALD